MTPADTHAPRLFDTEAQITTVGEGLLACTLPRPRWTHEAHLAACLYLVLRRPDIRLETELPGIISRYNISVGGENTDTSGYHETITQFYIRVVRAFAAEATAGPETALLPLCNRLLTDERGQRDYPLRFWSRDALFSVPARRGWVEPDVEALPF
ncbi:MAG TPA: hypothetical protein VIG90_01300 [Pedomonas sp.]|uniref:hypothetical protein n=1 Tax=Pedomonas sp. TaxID=2976421 RepID=UPI002F426382